MLRHEHKIHPLVLAGLDPAIHGPTAGALQAGVDARHKAGDGRIRFLSGITCLSEQSFL
jgi:hypothetical protein